MIINTRVAGPSTPPPHRHAHVQKHFVVKNRCARLWRIFVVENPFTHTFPVENPFPVITLLMNDTMIIKYQ